MPARGRRARNPHIHRVAHGRPPPPARRLPHAHECLPLAHRPAAILRRGPIVPVFQGDRMHGEIRIETGRRSRGPARLSGSGGAVMLAAAAGLVPREGWTTERTVGPLRRGPVGARNWVLESGDPLGLFHRRGPRVDAELALLLPQFTSLADRLHV